MAKSKSALAVALYLEFRRENHTAQIILTPPTFNPVKDKHEKTFVLNRQISDENPRRAWKFYTSENTADLGFALTMEEGVGRALPILNELSSFFSGFYAGGWELHQKPVAVEMSQDDLNDFSEGNTPNALIRRILRARTEAGFPEELWADSTTATVPTSTTSV